MKITEPMLRRVAPNINNARLKELVPVFNEWQDRFEINTPIRIAMFFANVLHESAALSRVVENLNYSAEGLLKVFPKYFNAQQAKEYARKPEKIANRVYANRIGNGNEDSGDGWKYRGRGLIQLTGFSNYAMYEKSGYCNGELTLHPEWLEKFPGAIKSAMWFWKSNGLNTLADRGDMTAVCKRINGGLNGLADRNYYYNRFKKEFGL